ncbi:hypothetical protein [Butyricicoccus sp.]|uniref:hypothetical protein n=1 Tax=Butyricicoccus sp. TaxID=2049021 RepID=UPI003F16DBE7
MNKISKQITKKSIVQRQSSFLIRFIGVLLVIAGAFMVWDSKDWSILLFCVPYLGGAFLLIVLFVRRNDWKVIKKIEKQEKYLGVSFDDDMRDVLMGGILSNGVEAAAYGDWYTLISTGGIVAVNRRYVTGVKEIQRRTRSGRYTSSTFIDMTFDTIENRTMKFTTGNSWQAAQDLKEWLEAYRKEEQA